MKKALAVLSGIALASAAITAPASAQHWHGGGFHGGYHGGWHDHGWHHGGGRTGAFVGGAIAGAVVDRALFNHYHQYGNRWYDGSRYYYSYPYEDYQCRYVDQWGNVLYAECDD